MRFSPAWSEVEVLPSLVQRMRLGPFLGGLLLSLHVGVKFLAIHPPHPAPAELDPGQLTGSDERVRLRRADVQVGSHVLEGKKPRLDPRGPPPRVLKILHVANAITQQGRLLGFPSTCSHLAMLTPPSLERSR